MDRVCCIRGVSIYLHRMITTSHAGFRHVLQCLDRDLEGFATVLFCPFFHGPSDCDAGWGERQTNKQVQKKIFINFSSSWLISFSASRTITNLFLIDDKSHTVFYRGQAQWQPTPQLKYWEIKHRKLKFTGVSAWLEIYTYAWKILMISKIK